MLDVVPTQAERRASTRQALLDAAAHTLVQRGASGFTTAAVASTAGLSNGALFRYFPTRLDLVAATVEHVLARLRHMYEERFTAARPADATPAALLALLWECMSDPELAAVYELYTQCRSDDDLLRVLQPIVVEHGDHIRELASTVNAELGLTDPVVAEGITGLAILAMQGLVINNLAGTALGVERDLIAMLDAAYTSALPGKE
jgi:AcrR family transcriptional regulator